MERFYASVEAVRRGEEPPEDGYRGEYVHELAAHAGRSRAADARADRGDARALPRPLRHLGARERVRGRDPRGDRPPRHLRGGGRGLGADERARRRQGPRPRPLGRHSDLLRRATPRTSGGSTRAASTGSSTSSAPTTTATSRGCRRSRRCSGTRRESLEVLVYQLVHLVEGGRGEEGLEAPRRRRLPRRAPRHDRRRRGALVPRLARPRPDDRARRRPRHAAHAEEPGLLRPVRARANRRNPPERGRKRPCNRSSQRVSRRAARGGGARPREAAARVPRARRRGHRAARAARDPDLRDPRRGRLPPLLPPPPRARLRAAGVPARALRARRSSSSPAAST